jgi:YegS/Rv2252/BmrU family lipid kinase
MKKLRLILNPIAGHGFAPRLAKLVDKSPLVQQYEIDICTTEYAGHGRELSEEAVRSGYEVVVAAGGDGTINEVAAPLKGTSTLLGIIPSGSGNGLARHIGMSSQPEIALRQIDSAVPTAIDTLEINGRFAVNVSGLGFDGYVAWLFNKGKRRGVMNYTRIALKEYFNYMGASINLEVNGKSINHHAHMLVIANASQFGNAAKIAPMADLRDGQMELVLVKKPPLFQMLITFYRLFKGNLRDNQYIQTIPCSSFTATCQPALHLHIDGEGVDPVNRVVTKLYPASLQLLMPLS